MLALTFCSRDRISEQPAKGQSLEASAAINTAAQANSFLDKLASEISKVPDQKFFQTISDKALEEKDGDRDFIYHVDKADPAISEQFKAIEQTLGKAAFDKLPLLNVYVYAPYTPDNAAKKPRIYYWPLGKSEKDIKEVIGYREGQQITADGQTPPSPTEGAIFVIGINERVTYQEKQEGRSSILLEDGQKLLGSSDKYNFFLPGDDSVNTTATRNYSRNVYRVTYSRLASMSALRDFEPWGKGDAEVAFIGDDGNYGFIRWGYTRTGGFLGMERFSIDNYTPSGYFGFNRKLMVVETDGYLQPPSRIYDPNKQIFVNLYVDILPEDADFRDSPDIIDNNVSFQGRGRYVVSGGRFRFDLY